MLAPRVRALAPREILLILVRVLHELGGLMNVSHKTLAEVRVPARALASIIFNLHRKRVTNEGAKKLLALAFAGDTRHIETIIREEDLEVKTHSEAEYRAMAEALVAQHPEIADKVRQGQKGKLQWFVGQMMRGHTGMDPQEAARALKPLLGLDS
jgi:Asp-tRNA(Asn)/Glu-tRNA(Gln) amidotransferase B subunit